MNNKANALMAVGVGLAYFSRQTGSRALTQVQQLRLELKELTAEALDLTLTEIVQRTTTDLATLQAWLAAHPTAANYDGDQLVWSQIKNIPLPLYTHKLGYTTLGTYYQSLREVQRLGLGSIGEAYEYGKNLSAEEIKKSLNVKVQIVKIGWSEAPPEGVVFDALAEPIQYLTEVGNQSKIRLEKILGEIDNIRRRHSFTVLKGDEDE